MAEITTNQIGFYKDSNWYLVNNNTYVAFNALVMLSYEGMPSSEINKVFVDNFETTVEELKKNKLLLMDNRLDDMDSPNITSIVNANYTTSTKTLTISFFMHDYLVVGNLVYITISYTNNNGTLSCSKLARYDIKFDSM